MDKKNFKAYLAWINTCIIWGTTYIAIRIGVAKLPPFLFAGLRWIAAGTILLIYLKARGYKFPGKRELAVNAVTGTLLLGLSNGLVVTAEQWIPSGLTCLLITTVPFWVYSMELFLSARRSINYYTLGGLTLGLAGVCLIFGSDLKYLVDGKYLIGIIFLFLAVIMWAAGSVYSKYKKLETHPLMNSAVQMLIAGLLQTIFGVIIGESSRFRFETDSALAFAYLIVFGSLIGYTSYIYALNHLPVSLVSTYAYVNPVIALLLGWLVLNEEVGPMMFIASIVIITGVVLVKKGTENQQKILRNQKEEK